MGGLGCWSEEERIVVGVPIAECIHYIFKEYKNSFPSGKGKEEMYCTARKKDH